MLSLSTQTCPCLKVMIIIKNRNLLDLIKLFINISCCSCVYIFSHGVMQKFAFSVSGGAMLVGNVLVTFWKQYILPVKKLFNPTVYL